MSFGFTSFDTLQPPYGVFFWMFFLGHLTSVPVALGAARRLKTAPCFRQVAGGRNCESEIGDCQRGTGKRVTGQMSMSCFPFEQLQNSLKLQTFWHVEEVFEVFLHVFVETGALLLFL